jgi:hypothetical protein
VSGNAHSIYKHLYHHGYEVVRPTARLVRHWWLRCLGEVFEYPRIKALVPKTVEIRPQHDEWAACHWPDPLGLELHLTHHDEPISRNGLVTIICHEEVHAILAYEDQDKGRDQHGVTFMRYAEVVERKTGLVFQDRYSREDIERLGRRMRGPSR